MGDMKITIFWKNFHGETVYVEESTLAEVLTLLEEDERAMYNRYVLPSNEQLDDIQLREWYVAQMQAAYTTAA
jgi:hypothetical protein